MTGNQKRSVAAERTNRQVLRLLTYGFTNRDIADTLHITERTTKAHMKRAFNSYGISEMPGICKRVKLAMLVYTKQHA